MTVTVFQTTFETSLWGLQDVRVSIIGPPSEFKIGVDFAPKERKKVELPFGLKPPKRPRKPNKKKKNIAKKGGELPPDIAPVYSDDNDNDSAHADNESNDSDSDLQKSDLDEFEPGLHDPNQLEEPQEEIAHPTVAAQAEENAVGSAYESFQEDVAMRVRLAASHRSGSSFFQEMLAL